MTYLKIKDAYICLPEGKFIKNFALHIGSHSVLAILVKNSSLFSPIGEILCQNRTIQSGILEFQVKKEEISRVPFNSLSLFPKQWEMYYQKRFNQFDSEAIPRASEFLSLGQSPVEMYKTEIIKSLNLEALLDRKIHQLSHGEMKRFLLAKALFSKPKMLILENPYEGIDPENKDILDAVFKRLIEEGMALIFLLNSYPIPEFIKQVIDIQPESIEPETIPKSKEGKNQLSVQIPPSYFSTGENGILPEKYILEMNKLSIRYGEVYALKDFSWKVKTGEKWFVSGPNGSGKSTLLSLITGDHPQAYQENFKWMGKPRGSGESIWDIKKKIGFMSPEMMVYLPYDQTIYQMVASGLFDTMGLFRKLKPEEQERVENFLELFYFEDRRNLRVRALSVQDQRLVLLARAFIKDPEILILDEPFQGLESALVQDFKRLLENLWKGNSKTLLFTSHKETDIPLIITHTLRLEPGEI